jgi:hypothetical protein
LRRAFEPFAVNPVCQDARLQVAAYQPQHPLVRDPLGQPVHQDVMVDAVEEFLQVHVYHDPVAGLHVLLRLQHRAMRAAPRPEAVAVLAERRVDERLQHLQQRLLDQSVHGCGYPELASPAPRLWYAHAAHRLGPVAAVEQPGSDVGPRLLEIFARVLHRASVDAGTSLIGLHAFPRAGHILSGQRLPKQVVCPPVRLCTSRQYGFITHGFRRDFTASRPRASRSPRLLMQCPAKRHVS